MAVSAENFVEISVCETEMLKAFSKADEMLDKNFQEYLNLEDITAVAKANNLDSYDRTYQCQTAAICNAMQNPLSEAPFNSEFNECNLQDANTSISFQKSFEVDFSSCAPTLIEHESWLSNRCIAFAKQKNRLARNTISSQFIDEVHLQNQTLLAGKILDIRKKWKFL